MNGIFKKTWHGLLFVLTMLAMVDANAAATDVTITSTPLLFATPQKVGTESAAQNVTLTAGTAAVTFEAIGIESSNFSLEGDTCGSGLGAGATCTLPVKFTPVAAGKRYAELVIRSPDASNATNGALTVYLQGTAIGKYSQTISFGAAPTITVGGTGSVSATATPSNLAVTYSSTTIGVCTISGSTVIGVAAGTCTIAADQAGNADYNPATQTQNITIGKGSQTVAFTSAPTTVAVGGTNYVSSTATSGLPVSFGSTTPGVCTITPTVSGVASVQGVSAGTCSITADQAGNANYIAATQATRNITINTKTDQTITFGTAPTVVAGGTGSASATASSGLAVTYSSTTPGICTISGSTVTGVAAGTCTIAANQAGNDSVNPATQVTQSFSVAAAAAADALCTTYALPNTIEVPKAGNISKYLSMPANGAYAFTFTTGADGTVGSSNTQYSTVNQYMTISKNKCDFSPALPSVCGKQGKTAPFIRWKVGGASDGIQCILEPNTLYYVNLRDANLSGGTYTSTCPNGGCNFKLY